MALEQTYSYGDYDYHSRWSFNATQIKTEDGVEDIGEDFLVRNADEYVYPTLVKEFLYVLAIFGMIEIEEKAPEELLLKTSAAGKTKTFPLSEFESIQAFRLTEYGKYVFCHRGTLPDLSGGGFEAIVDD